MYDYSEDSYDFITVEMLMKKKASFNYRHSKNEALSNKAIFNCFS